MNNNYKKINTNKKTLIRLFPYINNKNNIHELKIDNESIHYISIREVAEIITKLIIKHVHSINIINMNDITITDATAGVGGNTISFCKHFNNVNAIELHSKRFEYLSNNIKVYDLNNISLYNNSCLKILGNIKQDIVFIDPPWGGKYYKNHDKLLLTISDVPIESIINNLLNNSITKYPPKLIVLKIPKNYDLLYFYDNIFSNKIYLHSLKKMFILIIENNNII
tara:strand:- start:359 stop:1030 length:672 start_codon:yes stop_codon:yes gene_type:complete